MKTGLFFVVSLLVTLSWSGVQAQVEPFKGRTLAVHLWSYEKSAPEGQEVLGQLASRKLGGQSRDWGSRIRDLADQGKIVREEGCHLFWLEFRHYDESGGSAFVFVVNGETRSHQLSNKLQVEVCDGVGGKLPGGYVRVPISPPWNSPGITLLIHSSFSAMKYPKKGVLRTCGPSTMEVCEKSKYDPDKPAALWGQLRSISEKKDTTHYHFVK